MTRPPIGTAAGEPSAPVVDAPPAPPAAGDQAFTALLVRRPYPHHFHWSY